MYNVVGVLGTTVANVTTHEAAHAAVLQQIPLGKVKSSKLANRLAGLRVGVSIEVDYGESTVMVTRMS